MCVKISSFIVVTARSLTFLNIMHNNLINQYSLIFLIHLKAFYDYLPHAHSLLLLLLLNVQFKPKNCYILNKA